MRYYARIGDNEYEIDVDLDKEQVVVDGSPMTVDFSRIGVPELYSLIYNGHSYEVLVEAERFNYGVTLRGEHFLVQVEDERSRRLNAGRRAPALPEGELAVKAPIPGLVVKVLIEPGAAVEEEQPLLILEAMKMENEIRSPRSGVVKKVEVAAGQRVEQNAVLVVVE